MFRLSFNKHTRRLLALIILVATLGVFVYYAAANPDKVIEPLAGLSTLVIIIVLIAYMGVTYTNSIILQRSLKILDKTYGHGEAFLLTAYSSIVNFFGPLQSGPGFRALYLKQKLGVRMRDYTLTLIVYYLFYGLINVAVIGLYLVSQSGIFNGTLLIVLGLLAFLGFFYVLKIKLAESRMQKLKALLASQHAVVIFTFTLLQCMFTLVVYFTELLAVNSSVTLLQAMLYTAVANLTLFVALTPGAIGIRESFLLFSQQMHGISQETIIAASIIDRALYFVVLGLLFLFSISMHANKRLRLAVKTTADSQHDRLQ